jgi:hypothetical protein
MKKFRVGVHRVSSITILILLWTAALSAQEMAVPVKLHLALLLKVLSYDRNLKQRAGDQLIIAVCYQKKYERSVKVKEELLGVIESSSVDRIGDIPLRFGSIDIGEEDLAKAISRDSVDVLYIAPLRDVAIQTITAVSRARKATTLTGVPDYVESGLAVSIGIKGEKPQIIINLPAAEAEGADFSSQLLKLAKVIK